jgi:hypothetical protein
MFLASSCRNEEKIDSVHNATLRPKRINTLRVLDALSSCRNEERMEAGHNVTLRSDRSCTLYFGNTPAHVSHIINLCTIILQIQVDIYIYINHFISGDFLVIRQQLPDEHYLINFKRSLLRVTIVKLAVEFNGTVILMSFTNLCKCFWKINIFYCTYATSLTGENVVFFSLCSVLHCSVFPFTCLFEYVSISLYDQRCWQ